MREPGRSLKVLGTSLLCAMKPHCRPMRQAFTHVVSASAGAGVSAFVRVPTDTLKHRVQAYVLPDVFRARPIPLLCGLALRLGER